jgi:hypothetical protein
MAAQRSRVAWMASGALALLLLGVAVLRMKGQQPSPAPPSSDASEPPPKRIEPARSAAGADGTAGGAGPARDAGAASSEAALLQEIEADVRLGRIGHARSLADRFYRAFPGSPAIAQIERLTGYHPRPYGPGR